ncbi:MAG: aldehyde dehydrogenase family protein [Marmoricola sp.]
MLDRLDEAAQALEVEPPLDRDVFTVYSPARGTELGRCPTLEVEDVARRVAALRAGQPAWDQLGVQERASLINRFGDWILAHEDDLARRLASETGKTLFEARLEIAVGIDLLRYSARTAPRFLAPEKPRPHNVLTATKRVVTSYRPYPVVGVIVPWNFPVGLTLFDAVPALLAGASVVVKPSEFAPLAVSMLADGWRACALPAVFDVVTGFAAAGEAVVDAADFVQFTGSTSTGTLVAQRAAARLTPVGLELGGKDAAIVLEDADLKLAAKGIAFGALSNAGQMCTSIERVYVVDSVHDAFVDELSSVVGSLRTQGDPSPDIGVMTTPAQMQLVRRHIAEAVEAGAVIRAGGVSEHEIAPTVLTGVDQDMSVMTDETFGPVIPVMRVRDEDEAVALANQSSYGLSGSVWTRDRSRGRRLAARLECGSVDVNDASAHLVFFGAPQTGWKKSGIGGRLGGPDGIRRFCRTQAVVDDRVVVPVMPWLAWYPRSPLKDFAVTRAFRILNRRASRALAKS